MHGWTGSDTHTSDRTGDFSSIIDLTANALGTVDTTRSLIGQFQNVPGAAVFTFDYHPYSARWVDDSHLGPALGKVIDCLYQASGQKVIVVAHSMGGLVTRYAATHPGPGAADRSREISTVVTFGTPETGSVAALLGETLLDQGAVTNQTLALIRTILAVCGSYTSNEIETGTLCDRLYAPARALESTAGQALRYGSPQLAALKPWPAGITVDALAGQTTFQVPDLGWFALPWDTVPVNVGDIIVTADSAQHGATLTKTVSCDYQLNPARGAGDFLDLRLRLASKADIAQEPLKAFTGACFHVDLMRGIELTNEALGAVADDLSSRQPVTAADLLSAPVPAACEHDAGTLTGGRLAGIPANHGSMELAWLDGGQRSDLLALGDLNGDGYGDAAATLACNAGGVAWPELVAFYTPGPHLLGYVSLGDINAPGRQPGEHADVYQLRYDNGAVVAEWSTPEDGDPGAMSSLDYTATLRWNGHGITAANLSATTELATAAQFVTDIRHGDAQAAQSLSAAGVAAEAANQLRSYPDAFQATPSCYGENSLDIPAPAAGLTAAGGPQWIQNAQRICLLPATATGAHYVALAMNKQGFQRWQVTSLAIV
ncbi:esterase/lipase family protein [Streptacidiphilus pinicola]|uniref:esterase/lipase family protein n=1 Tax=Streptacidiphilus pinicola TaxID=2219663 RepID=UPI001403F474|nr:hypothetical protein [Streptacidiphilus pinicola]